MKDWSDSKLLAEYAVCNSQQAFAELASRHLNMVYSAALRSLGISSSEAEDVVQKTFALLASNANRLLAHPCLAGWLYKTATQLAINQKKEELRRKQREARYLMNEEHSGTTEDLWGKLRPVIDLALNDLSEKDRNAVVLRYLENYSLRQVGDVIGQSENTARMTVARAIDKLRLALKRRGVVSSTSSIVAAIEYGGISTAPASLLGGVVSSAIILKAGSASIPLVGLFMQLNKTAATIAVLFATAGIVTPFVQHTRITDLENNLRALRLQAHSVGDLEQENRRQTEKLKGLQRLFAERNPNGSLQIESDQATVESKVELLKRKLASMPNLSIPEMALATEKDWAKAAWDADLGTDDGVREALSKVRETVQRRFLLHTREALQNYQAAHNGGLPPDLFELKPYYGATLSDEMISRYELIRSNSFPSPEYSIRGPRKVVDSDYDSSLTLTKDGISGNFWNSVRSSVETAAAQFALEHGQWPAEASHLYSYLKKSLEDAAIQKYLNLMEKTPDKIESTRSYLTLQRVIKAFEAANPGEVLMASRLLPYATTPEEKEVAWKYYDRELEYNEEQRKMEERLNQLRNAR